MMDDVIEDQSVKVHGFDGDGGVRVISTEEVEKEFSLSIQQCGSILYMIHVTATSNDYPDYNQKTIERFSSECKFAGIITGHGDDRSVQDDIEESPFLLTPFNRTVFGHLEKLIDTKKYRRGRVAIGIIPARQVFDLYIDDTSLRGLNITLQHRFAISNVTKVQDYLTNSLFVNVADKYAQSKHELDQYLIRVCRREGIRLIPRRRRFPIGLDGITNLSPDGRYFTLHVIAGYVTVQRLMFDRHHAAIRIELKEMSIRFDAEKFFQKCLNIGLLSLRSDDEEKQHLSGKSDPDRNNNVFDYVERW